MILSSFAFPLPSLSAQEIEYGMTRKTYEIAGIEVEGADSYEDFVLIGFSGLAVTRSPKLSNGSGNKVCSQTSRSKPVRLKITKSGS